MRAVLPRFHAYTEFSERKTKKPLFWNLWEAISMIEKKKSSEENTHDPQNPFPDSIRFYVPMLRGEFQIMSLLVFLL